MSHEVDSIFGNYLSELTAHALRLSPEVRDELLSGISEYLHAAREGGEASNPAAAMNLLARVGDPTTLVDAAIEASGQSARRESTVADRFADERHTSTGRKVLLLLTIGSFLPVVGWLYGVSIVWRSALWSRASKIVATVVVPGGPLAAIALAFWLGNLTQQTCSSETIWFPILDRWNRFSRRWLTRPGASYSMSYSPTTGRPSARSRAVST
jgi:hypothetical protein